MESILGKISVEKGRSQGGQSCTQADRDVIIQCFLLPVSVQEGNCANSYESNPSVRAKLQPSGSRDKVGPGENCGLLLPCQSFLRTEDRTLA